MNAHVYTIRYPEHPQDLPQDTFDKVYNESPPVHVAMPSLPLVEAGIPMRSSAKLLRGSEVSLRQGLPQMLSAMLASMPLDVIST